MVTKLQQSVLYRICTEDRPQFRHAIIRALRRNGFRHFTLVSTAGYGPGQRGLEEYSVVIEILVEDYRGPDTDGKIETIAGEIRRKNDQQTVLLMRIPAFHKFKVARRSSKNRQNQTHTIRHHLRRQSPDICFADKDGRPRPPRKRASYRTKILVGLGEWKKLLGSHDAIPDSGGIIRFFPDDAGFLPVSRRLHA